VFKIAPFPLATTGMIGFGNPEKGLLLQKTIHAVLREWLRPSRSTSVV